MSQPIVVTLPHRLGKAEALRRLQVSFRDAQSSGAGFMVFKNQWSGDHMDFRASLLGQSTCGTVDVCRGPRQARGATSLASLAPRQQSKGLSGKAGQAPAGKTGQALYSTELTPDWSLY